MRYYAYAALLFLPPWVTAPNDPLDRFREKTHGGSTSTPVSDPLDRFREKKIHGGSTSTPVTNGKLLDRFRGKEEKKTFGGVRGDNDGDRRLPIPFKVASKAFVLASTSRSPAPEGLGLGEPEFLQNGDRIIRRNFTRPGASFIKIHFDNFNIPPDALVTVSSPDGNEVYHYTMENKTYATVDEGDGDDGTSSFSAMSIEGDTALLEIHMPRDVSHNLLQSAFSDLSVDSFLHGHDLPDMEPGHDDDDDDERTRVQSTCGSSNLLDVECARGRYADAVDRSRPVARLLVGRASCTAWRVGPTNLVFSNHHCLATEKQIRSAELHFNYRRSSCGGRYSTRVVKVTGANLVSGDYRHDYVLFTVNNFESIRKFGYQGLEPRTARQDEPIYIPQHPTGRPKQIAIESDQNDNNHCIVDNPIWGRTRRDVGYRCDTRGGASGAPVLSARTHNVIALHHYGGCPNTGVLFRYIWPMVRTFFNGQVPQSDRDAHIPSNASTPTMRVLQGGCGISTRAGITCVTSPNFPRSYPNSDKCIIVTTETGWMQAHSFVTEPIWDWLLLLSEYYSGTQGPRNVKTPAGTKFYWRTNQWVPMGGWRMCLRVETDGAFRGNKRLRNQLRRRFGRRPARNNNRRQLHPVTPEHAAIAI